MVSRHRRLVVFVLVGCAAAAVHLATVKLLVDGAGVLPLASNIAGWLLAFGVSFFGHHRMTFGDQRSPAGRAMRRFFLLSAVGFSVNELSYATLLTWSPLRYDVALAVVLVGVAAFTYLLSRHWAFLGKTVH